MLYLCKFLKINWRNGNRQIVHVGFVRHIFNTLDSKLALCKNSFWNSMGKQEKNNMCDKTVRTKILILELIKFKIFFDDLW